MDGLERADAQKMQILQVQLQTLEAENKRLRVALDWMWEKFLETETKLWSDKPVKASCAQQPRGVGYAPSAWHQEGRRWTGAA